MKPSENIYLEKELRKLSDTQLLENTFDLAKKEQQTTLSLLFHLKEVNERRSYALLGCSSLWEYTVKVLGYGESGASERINAMRLLIQIPELKEKLEAGKMTLTTASQAQRFFQAERKFLKKNYSVREKLQVLEQIEGCSKREVEQKLVALSPGQARLPSQLEKTRTLPESKTEVKFVADSETMEMIKRMREIKGSEFSLSEILKLFLKTWLVQNDPEQKYSKKSKKNAQDLARRTGEASSAKPVDVAESLARKTGAPRSEDLAGDSVDSIESVANERVENFSKKSLECFSSKINKNCKNQSFDQTPKPVDPGLTERLPFFRKTQWNSNALEENKAVAKVRKTLSPTFASQSRQVFSSQNKKASSSNKLDWQNNAPETHKSSRYISIAVRRKIYARAKGQCEYKSPLNGKRCESKSNLQWDHIHPHALGGSSSEDNIALICFSHNQRRAIEVFGRKQVYRKLFVGRQGFCHL